MKRDTSCLRADIEKPFHEGHRTWRTCFPHRAACSCGDSNVCFAGRGAARIARTNATEQLAVLAFADRLGPAKPRN
jgi:hypothetical protein